MKTVVTGANGFLGSWLVKRLLAEGYQVKALVRENSDVTELADVRPEFVYGDVTDKKSLIKAFDHCDVVFHLAGVVSYKKSARPLMDRVNIDGTQNVVDTLEILQGPKLLHLSSVAAIGSSFKPEVRNENSSYDISHLNLGYFETKKKAEEIVIQSAQAQKIHAVCVNPSTIYGYGDAKKSSRKNQLKVARGELKFYTSGGVNVVSVEDVIEGIILALNKGKSGQRYILGSENLTIKQLFETIAKVAGIKPPSFLIPDFLLHTLGCIGDQLEAWGKPIGISRENSYTATMFHWFDHSKAKNELGFNPGPAYSAIEKSVTWMKQQNLLR